MRLRGAKAADIPAMGRIQADANHNDTLVRYFNPKADLYPTSYQQDSTRFVKRQVSQIGAVTHVVETEPSDYPSNDQHKAPEVVGFALWTRHGTSDKAREWQQANSDWYTALNRTLHSIEDSYYRTFPSVRAAHNRKNFLEILPTLATPFDAEIFVEAWELDLFYVDPKWQRRGLGRRLMQWGFDRATEEQVPVAVKGSAIGGLTYRGLGFKAIGDVGLHKFFDTLALGGIEPTMWVWEPPGCEGIYIDRAREAWNKSHSHGGDSEDGIPQASLQARDEGDASLSN